MRQLLILIAALSACNSPPEALLVSITPGDPTTSDDLVAAVDGAFTDPDGDEVSYSFTWYADDVAQDHLTSLSIPARETSKHQVWKLFVQPTDGKLEGPPSEASVTILNTPPAAEVNLSPELPLTSEDVVATVTSTDTDGDEVTLAYAWILGGEATGYQDSTLPASATERGDVWTVEVTPNDGEADGEPAQASISIDNSAPKISSVTLMPTAPQEGDTVTASVSSMDDDDDEVTLAYSWTVDDELVQEGEADTLTGELFDKHQQIAVTVTPSDGFVEGEPVSSDPVTAANTAPLILGAQLEPSEIFEASEVCCVAQGWHDDDEDDEGYRYQWLVNDAEVGTEATLTGEHFDRGDSVACTATPDDGDDTGDPVTSDAVAVSNTAPVISSATLSTTSPAEGDTISVSVSASDDDGDSVAFSYTWLVDGSQVATTESIDSSLFDKHQSILVELTPTDGIEDGAVFSSAAATAVNTAPEITSLAPSPSELYTDDVLAASVGTTDADGDTVSLSYAWTVDGTAVSETGSSLDGADHFDKGQLVVVVVTPSDGEDDGATASDSATVLNSPPGAPMLTIDPAEPEAEVDDLVCSIETDSVDVDGDSVSYSFAWDVDGVSFTDTTTTTWADDTALGEHTEDLEEWTCTVTPSDGVEAGDTASASVTPRSCSGPR